MEKLIKYLEERIERCIEFGDMEKEKWAFGIAIKKAREINEEIECYPKGFLKWVGLNYVRLNEVWVHRFDYQSDKQNWRTTEQLINLYKTKNAKSAKSEK